jgi:UDP-N-acetylenolpyruvoylglucosamine reductase
MFKDTEINPSIYSMFWLNKVGRVRGKRIQDILSEIRILTRPNWRMLGKQFKTTTSDIILNEYVRSYGHREQARLILRAVLRLRQKQQDGLLKYAFKNLFGRYEKEKIDSEKHFQSILNHYEILECRG